MNDAVRDFMVKHPVSEWCENFSPASKIIHGALRKKKRDRGVKETQK
ncbi:hypothetical protein ES705_32517 [subsurface metagenome]